MTNFSFILMFFCLQIQASAYSQNTRLSLKLDNVSVKQLFVEIEKMTDIAFVYNANDVDHLGNVNVNFTNEEISKILDYCLKGKGIGYSFVNNHVVIKKEEVAAPQQKRKTISGKVIDKTTGEVLPGATIKIKGTNIGTAADIDGKFQLTVVGDVPTLEVTFVGYKSMDVVVGKREYLEIKLDADVTEMAAVLVTGIFTRKADSYTGAVTTIKAEELKRVGNQNILQSLKNIDPSFQVLESNDFGSDPNRVPEIQMRGASSFSDMKDKYQTNPNQPLFIVDGFEQTIEKVMDMDMNRVASITLLKDATAKALYGSKGANGVVVIETITPEVGKLKVSYSGNLNIQTPDLGSYNLANAAEKLAIEKRAGVYTDEYGDPRMQQLYDEKYNEYYKEVQRGVNSYWLNKPLRTGVGHKHSLNFEGGDDVIRYNIDFSYNKIAGVMKGSGREVISGGFNFQYRFRNLLFRDQLSVTFNKADESPYGAFSEYAKLNPYWRPYNEDGSVREIMGDYAIANSQGEHPIYNPLTNAFINTKNNNEYTDITNNFYIEWDAFQGMKFKGRFGLISNKSENELFLPRDHTSFKNIKPDTEEYFNRGSYTMGNGKRFDYNADVSANYMKQMGKHLVFANAQWSFSERKYDFVEMKAQGFANNKMDYITNAKEYSVGAPVGNESLSREASALVSGNYSYDDRYLMDATYRANASSLFGKDKRWGHFWSAGIGWNVHNEKFLADAKFLEKLRLRASTGYSGSQNFNSYQAVATYKYYNESYDNIIGSQLLGLANPNLQWQKTQDNNFGVDLAILNTFDITFDYYIKKTKNLLTPVSLPPSAGFNSYTENLGETSNKGIEAKINYRILKDTERNIYLSVFASAMHNKNKITKISDALSVMNNNRDSDKANGGGGNPNLENNGKVTKPSVRYAEGQSMNAIWAVQSLGIDPMTGEEVFLSADGKMVYKWDPRDQVVVGDELPKVSGTFGFNFEYKGFSVNTSFYYRLGGKQYNQTLVDKVENVDIQYNVDKRMLDGRWSTPGVAAPFRRFNINDPLTRPTSRFVQKLNELQMTSLNVGYDFRYCKFMQGHLLERLKVEFYMNDVFRASTVKAERGIEYPFSRSFAFSVQATF
ncbi:MAG: SusC/RagA family TonB-linked outer membrane protein [Odoribacter sp.]